MATDGSSSGRKGSRRYRECLKNHAVGIGGHAVDGCGEFMAAGEEGTLDALKCAACNCHRNFHRKEAEGEVFHQHQQFTPYYRTPAGYLQVAPQQHRTLVLPSTSGGGGHSRDDQEDDSNPSGGSKKRFRTKFTQEQKDKMLAFAERVEWRIQKEHEDAVQQFCAETGVKRHVLKFERQKPETTVDGRGERDEHTMVGIGGSDLRLPIFFLLFSVMFLSLEQGVTFGLHNTCGDMDQQLAKIVAGRLPRAGQLNFTFHTFGLILWIDVHRSPLQTLATPAKFFQVFYNSKDEVTRSEAVGMEVSPGEEPEVQGGGQPSSSLGPSPVLPEAPAEVVSADPAAVRDLDVIGLQAQPIGLLSNLVTQSGFITAPTMEMEKYCNTAQK
ncbi:hypothetical protein HHK36_031938 [Tetracentron sinense]|uniref:ZF-HD dimerization-type domain-containing protein n=1 Tax=Tetracentron sinense TaxID=13715 RepID=A0A834YAG4_TETSI|nr:hypothetical protein HHK36_031938 [Tetracentron sinense]